MRKVIRPLMSRVQVMAGRPVVMRCGDLNCRVRDALEALMELAPWWLLAVWLTPRPAMVGARR